MNYLLDSFEMLRMDPEQERRILEAEGVGTIEYLNADQALLEKVVRECMKNYHHNINKNHHVGKRYPESGNRNPIIT